MQFGQSLATDLLCNFTPADIKANEKIVFFFPTDESEVSIVIEKLKKNCSMASIASIISILIFLL